MTRWLIFFPEINWNNEKKISRGKCYHGVVSKKCISNLTWLCNPFSTSVMEMFRICLLHAVPNFFKFLATKYWSSWFLSIIQTGNVALLTQVPARANRLCLYLGFVNLVAGPESSVLPFTHTQDQASVAMGRQIFLDSLCISVPLHCTMSLYPHWNQVGILLCEAPYNHAKIHGNKQTWQIKGEGTTVQFENTHILNWKRSRAPCK